MKGVIMSVLKCSPLIGNLRDFGYRSWNCRFLNKSFLILSGNFCWATVGVWINFLWQWQPWAIFAFLSNFWAKRCLKNILKICQYLRATLSSFVSSYLSRPLLAMIHHILFITHHMTEYSPLNLGDIREYHPSHITQFSKLYVHDENSIKDAREPFCGCYRRREICFFFVISQSWEITIKRKHSNQQTPELFV